MPKHEQSNGYIQKFNHHIKKAEAYKNQKAYDAAIAEYVEALKPLKTIWLEQQKQAKNILTMFKHESFDDQNVTTIKRGIAECYLAKGDLDNADKILALINREYLKDVAAFDQQFAELRAPVKDRVEHEAWIAKRSRVNVVAKGLLATTAVHADAQKAFNVMGLYMDNSKYLSQEERELYNRLSDAYDRFDAGRHPMRPVHKL